MSEIPATPPASTSPDLSIGARLNAAGLALTNAADEKIASALAGFGYTTAKLDEGRALLATAQSLTDQQVREYGEQYAATDALEQARTTANALYMRHVQLARLAFKTNRDARLALDLDGDRKQSLSGWLTQAKQFYTHLLDSTAYQTALAAYGRTLAELQQGRALVLGVEAAQYARAKEQGEAQEATKDRDVALDTLTAWLGEFTTVARLALAADPQWLEMLGITIAS